MIDLQIIYSNKNSAGPECSYELTSTKLHCAVLTNW